MSGPRSTLPRTHTAAAARRRRCLPLVVVIALLTAGVSFVAAPVAQAACRINDPTCGPPIGPPDPPPTPPTANTARFTWSIAHLSAAANGRVAAPNLDVSNESSSSPVTLNACGSTAAGGTSATGISQYVWTFGNGQPAIAVTVCSTVWQRPLSDSPASVPVTLTIVPQRGPTFGLTQSIRYRDVVVASVGDSAASGQGAPDSANTNSHPFSLSNECYRSGWAASAQSALRAQNALGSGVTVHFWFLACSGARITAADDANWVTASGPGSRTVDWGGMIDPYSNADNSRAGTPLPPQVDRLRALENESGLQIDTLLMTVGANDTNWAVVAPLCMAAGLGTELGEKACLLVNQHRVDTAVATVPAHFRLLAARLQAVVPAGRVYLTDYFDPLDSLSPQVPVCIGDPEASLYLRNWGVAHVETPLQNDVAAAAATAGWHYLSGFRPMSQGHGACNPADQPSGRWINDLYDSVREQKSDKGTWHANQTGQLHMADIETPVLLQSLATPAPGRTTAELLTRNTDGSWAGYSSAQLASTIPGTPAAVAATSTGAGTTQYLVATTDGRLWHTLRTAQGGWQQAGLVGGFPGRAVAVAATSSGPGVAQFLVVTSDGHVWHLLRNADGSWDPAGDVRIVTGFTGTPVAVAATSTGPGEAQFLIATREGSVFHTIRAADRSWQLAADIHGAGFAGTATSVAATSPSPGVSEFYVTTRDGFVYQTERRADGSWQSAVELHPRIGLSGTPVCVTAVSPGDGSTQIVVVTDDGRLMHAIRYANNTWQPAGDARGAVSLAGAATLAAAASPAPGVTVFVTVD